MRGRLSWRERDIVDIAMFIDFGRIVRNGGPITVNTKLEAHFGVPFDRNLAFKTLIGTFEVNGRVPLQKEYPRDKETLQ